MRRSLGLRGVLLSVLLTLGLASPVAAGDFRGDGSVTVAEGETVDDDLYIGAGTATIVGTVTGDATIGAGTVTVTGTVEGSLNVAGGTVDVLGDVGGAVRISGGTARVAGSVGRDVVVVGGTVTIDSGAEVGGEVAGGVGTMTMAGTVAGDLLVAAGTLEVTGTVEGSLDVTVGELVIGSEAVINGGVRYASDREARIADGAQIGGTVERSEASFDRPQPAISDNPIVSFLGAVLGLLLIGWGLLAIRPRLVIGSAAELRARPLPALGIGIGVWVGQFVVVILLFLLAALVGSLAGALGGAFVLPAILIILLVIILVFVSAVPVAMAIGRLVLPGNRSPYLAFAAGAAILALLVTVVGLVPALGAVAFFLVWVLGLGAFALYAWRTRTQPLVAAPPPPAAAPPMSATS